MWFSFGIVEIMRHRIFKTLVTLCICYLFSPQVFATPILFFGGELLEKDQIACTLQNFVMNFKERRPTPAKTKVHTNNSICIIEYGTSIENLFLEVIPQYNFKMQRFKAGDREITRKTYGMGDTFFQIIWRPINYLKDDVTSRFFVFAGVIAPTGDFDQQDKYSKQLGNIGRPLQPGTGNWALDFELY